MNPTDNLNSARAAVMGAALRRCRLFSGLTPAEIAEVTSGCVLRRLEKGEMLFREGAVSDGFYVLDTGAVSVFKLTPDGREQIICIFRPPDSFAEATLATVETYPANATALEASQVVVVPKVFFRDLIRRKPELCLSMLGAMSLHLKHLVQSIQDLKGTQVDQRLADWLLRQAPAATLGCPVGVDLPVAKKVLAGQLGVTSETLSRTLARLRRDGVVSVHGRRIQILNAARLRELAAE